MRAITLTVGSRVVDQGSDAFGFRDHSALFQSSDVAPVPEGVHRRKFITDYKDGKFFRLYQDEKTEYTEGLSKPLLEVAERLNLLGHTVAHYEKESSRRKELRVALAGIDIDADSPGAGEVGEVFWQAVEGASLSAYEIVQLLAANPGARNLRVNWAFGKDDMFLKRSTFVRPLDASKKFLIVTEGSSDANIIKHAFAILKPHVTDFFDFVDKQEGYSFSGSGNLFRFVQGLISIGVENNVIVVFDNDAEGVAGFNRCHVELNILDNMRVLKLPDVPEFREFEAIGPNGRHRANINGTAAAIECYLDLDGEPCVKWTSYNTAVNAYQGELIGKDRYKRTFLNQRSKNSNYDFTKVASVIDMIVSSCVRMKEETLDKAAASED